MMWVDDFLRVCMSVVVGGEELHVRALATLEVSERQWFASNKAKNLALILRDPKSDLHAVNVAPVQERSKDSLLRECLLKQKAELEAKARSVVLRVGTIEPEDGSPHAKVKADLETEKLEAEAEAERIKWVEETLGGYIRGMSTLKVGALRETVTDMIVDAMVDREFSRWTNYWSIREATFVDPEMTKHRFESPEEVARTSSTFTNSVAAAVLAVNAVDEEKLKNLPKGRPSED